ncbi:MAG TPA: polysaccharide deacetylase family protein [Flavobacteriales bacterium]|nr:polysaccharide deacetylase family protein [Flavobacteriales bacterium]
MRNRMRALALDGLSFLHASGASKYLRIPRVQFLYIHHTFTDEEKALETLLKKLQEHHVFISYSEAVEKVLSGNIDKPYIVFSSDDGFRNNLKAGEILQRFNVNACFFLNPALIGQNNYDIIRKHCEEKLHFPPVQFMDWHEVEQLQKQGHEIGAHTMWHIDIGKAGMQEVENDLKNCYRILHEKCGKALHFAFPYGLFGNFNEAARKSVFETGFVSCASAERGCHLPHNQPMAREELCIRRDHVILGWKPEHIVYFLQKSAKTANYNNNFFPYQR